MDGGKHKADNGTDKLPHGHFQNIAEECKVRGEEREDSYSVEPWFLNQLQSYWCLTNPQSSLYKWAMVA